MLIDLKINPSVDTVDNGELRNNPINGPIPLEKLTGIKKNGVLTPLNIQETTTAGSVPLVVGNKVYSISTPDNPEEAPVLSVESDGIKTPIYALNNNPYSLKRIDYPPTVVDVYSVTEQDPTTKKYKIVDVAVCEKITDEAGNYFFKVFGELIPCKADSKAQFIVESWTKEMGTAQTPKLLAQIIEPGAYKEEHLIYKKDGVLIKTFIGATFSFGELETEIHEIRVGNESLFFGKQRGVNPMSIYWDYSVLMYNSDFTEGGAAPCLYCDVQNKIYYQINEEQQPNGVLTQNLFEKGQYNDVELPKNRDKKFDKIIYCAGGFLIFQYKDPSGEFREIQGSEFGIGNNKSRYYGDNEVLYPFKFLDFFKLAVATIGGKESVFGLSLNDKMPLAYIGGLTGEVAQRFGNGVFYTTSGNVWRVDLAPSIPRKLNDNFILTGNMNECYNISKNRIEYYSVLYTGGWVDDPGYYEEEEQPPTVALAILGNNDISNTFASVKILEYVGEPDRKFSRIFSNYPSYLNVGDPILSIYSSGENIALLNYRGDYNNMFGRIDPEKIGTSYTPGIYEFLVPAPLWAPVNRKNNLIGNNDRYGFFYALPPNLSNAGKGQTGYLNYFIDSFFKDIEAAFFISGNFYVYQGGQIKLVEFDPNGAIRTTKRLTDGLEFEFIGNSTTEAFFLDRLNARVYSFRGYWEFTQILELSDYPAEVAQKGRVKFAYYSNAKNIFLFLVGSSLLLIRDGMISSILEAPRLFDYVGPDSLVIDENKEALFIVSIGETGKNIFKINFDVNGEFLNGLELETEWVGFPAETEARLNQIYFTFDAGEVLLNPEPIKINFTWRTLPDEPLQQLVEFVPDREGANTCKISPMVQTFDRFKFGVEIPKGKAWRLMHIYADITQTDGRKLLKLNNNF